MVNGAARHGDAASSWYWEEPSGKPQKGRRAGGASPWVSQKECPPPGLVPPPSVDHPLV